MKHTFGMTLALAFGLAGPAAADDATFESHVRPILKANCFICHGEEGKPKGGLDLRLRRLIVRGGDSGAAVVPGNRDGSLLFQRVRDGDMPPGKRKKLTPEEVAVLGRWIADGARVKGQEPETVGSGPLLTAEERGFWSFQPIRRPAVPPSSAGDRLRTPIDAFLRARLREKGLDFAPDADRRTLIRRASFDLTGLPPSPEEVQRFLADDSPDAYEKLLDRLLASPHYGERWGRHWLDVAGYADSEGYAAEDAVRPHAYKYRDYVIRSLNADKPFDRFIHEQLGGDEMVRPPYPALPPAEIDKLVATGFLRMAPDGTGSGGVDQAMARNQVVADTIRIVSTSLLGLTVGCAQCHDHKYDPIPQTDFYRLRAVLEPAYDPRNWRPPQGRRVSLYTEADRKKAQEIETEAAKIDAEYNRKRDEYIARTFEAELKKLPEKVREPIRTAHKTPAGKQTPEQKQLLKDYPSVNVTAGSLYLYDHKAAEDLKKIAAKATALRATKPVEDFVRALTETPGQAPVTHLFHRGEPAQPRQAVLPGGLAVLDDREPLKIAPEPGLPTSGRRLAYARWLTSGRHPLTARVLVNRVWMHHFGKGIVGTPGDFGFLGERPTHPELLDFLADDFLAGGWRLKRLHKVLMLSTAYRQAAVRDARRDAIDPDNRLLSRFSVRRLEAEVVRDAMLAVAGKLNRRMFGTPVPVMEDEVGQFVIGIENKNGENRPGPVLPMFGEEFRRSIYVQVRRSRPLGVLDTFDAPAMTPNCDARASSTVAPQALLLMNSAFMTEQARSFAERLIREATDPAARVARAWELAFGRPPDAGQARAGLEFLARQTEQFRKKPPANSTDPGREALVDLCHALLSANGFLYVD
jgi:mono/diheme cytochrome c family protein